MPRPKGKRIDIIYIGERLKALGMDMSDLPLSESTHTRISRGDPVSTGTVAAIARALGVAETAVLHPAERLLLAPSSNVGHPSQGQSETKNKIRADQLSASLIRGDKVPLSKCIEASPGVDVRDEKIQPLPGWTFVHFFQVAAVLACKLANGQLRYVVYSREPAERIPQFQLTQGRACSWGASFPSGSYREPRPADDWVRVAVDDPPHARELLTSPRNSVLAQLLEYKINLYDLQLIIEPMGIVTRDLRTDDGAGGVYSQWSFLTIIKFPDEVSAANVLSKRTGGIRIELVDSTFDWDNGFVNPKKQTPNLIDQLLWRALLVETRAPTLRADKAWFVRCSEDDLVR